MPRARPEEKRAHPTEQVPLSELKPHPRNYKKHPAEQLRHLVESLRQYGQFRNVVIARDGTILAGHGVVEAMRKVGWDDATCVRLDLDPMNAKALKLVALDNELPKFGQTDDRGLAELLRDVAADESETLLGTGYDNDAAAKLLREATGNFQPGTEDEQGRLDQLTPLKCQNCGAEVSRHAPR